MITLLDEWTIKKIKAAQIINNYYDIVKELVENSIDSNSQNIQIDFNIKNNLIKVIDDGIGMNEEDLKLSIQSHSTSKFISLDHINFLGFRGEGLYSISQCANILINSKKKDNLFGYSLYKIHNEFKTNIISTNNGTEVLVSHIFDHIPARKKFLNYKKDFINIIYFIQKMALACPSIKFNIYYNNKHYLLINGESYKDLIYQIFKINHFTEINIQEDLNPNQSIKIKMFLNQHLKENKGNILFYVNNRPVEDFGLFNILKNIFQQKYGHSNIDFLLFFLYIPYEYVDCNINPNKTQIQISILNELKNILNNHFTQKYIGIASEKLQEFTPLLDILNNWFIYDNKYVICDYNENIYFLDIHAISERLFLEKIKNEQYNQQILLEELTITLTEKEKILFLDNEENISKYKFTYEILGQYLLIYAIPDFLEISQVSNFVKALIHNENSHGFLHKLANISCKNSLRSKIKVNEKEILTFLSLINTNDVYHNCCHGRNTFKKFSKKDLDKIFFRS